MLRVTIDGETQEVKAGSSILDALKLANIEVPTLCHDDRIKPYGGCRLCIVETDGSPRPVTACNTPVVDSMVIQTHTPQLEDLRRTLIKLIARNYPAEAVMRFPDKQFHRYVREYGVETELHGFHASEAIDDSHPYIHVDMSQCIYCYRCVRICSEVQGQFVWEVWNRGDQTRIRPDSGANLLESSCVSCGACVDTCPSGALEDKTLLLATPTAATRTTCPYCGTGCEMAVHTNEDRIISIRPVLDAPVSKGHLCVKGRYAYDFIYAADRITKPMIRDGGDWEVVSWEEAVSFTAERLKSLSERYGPDSIGVLGSARATNEENYLVQKFARVVLGTNNVDCCARVCHGPTAAAMKMMLGTGAATSSFDDIERARTILVCGANPTENHPIVGARIKQAAIAGAHLIVIDPRQIELAQYADLHLQVRPGANVPLLNSIACVIVEERLYDESFLDERVSEWEEFKEFIGQWTPEKVGPMCGVEAEVIRNAARLYAMKRPSMSFHGLGVTEHTQGTESVMCLVNLALLTGNIGKPGTGINPLRGQNNVQGSAQMGCDPVVLTGAISLADGRNLFEDVWGAPIPQNKGLNLLEMMDAAAEQKLKALWAIGYDILLTNANQHMTRRALESLELVVVQDMFLNEIAREFGTVFLPVSSSFEKDGTFMNAERRIQRVRKVIERIDQSKPDWEVICLIARAMGKGDSFEFRSAEEVWDEIRTVWSGAAGISYDRLERGGLQWPCMTEADPGRSVLHTESFSGDTRAALRRICYEPTVETTTEEFPFLLITGRNLYQFNAGTMTMRTPNRDLVPTDYLEISVHDAERLAIVDGERVRVSSRYGEALLRIVIGDSIKPGELFATFNDPAIAVNHVTGPYRDSYVKTPEYKVTATRIEKL